MRGKLTLDRPETVIISGWIREQNAIGIEPLLTIEGEQQTLARGRPTIQDRAMLLLPVFAKRYGNVNVPSFLEELMKDAMLFGVSYSATFDEVHTLLRVLADDGFLDLRQPGRVLLRSRGLLKVEEIESKGGSGGQGFVAMSFSPALREVWTSGFDPAIRNAGSSPSSLTMSRASTWVCVQFGSRTSRLLAAGNRNASHPVNALLNYAYAVLQSQTQIRIIAEGYDPNLGIMHVDQEYGPAFVFDLMEPQRPKVDRAINEFLKSETLHPADFVVRTDGVVKLNPQMAKHVVAMVARTR
jgi:hypothetical protein